MASLSSFFAVPLFYVAAVLSQKCATQHCEISLQHICFYCTIEINLIKQCSHNIWRFGEELNGHIRMYLHITAGTTESSWCNRWVIPCSGHDVQKNLPAFSIKKLPQFQFENTCKCTKASCYALINNDTTRKLPGRNKHFWSRFVTKWLYLTQSTRSAIETRGTYKLNTGNCGPRLAS